MKTAGNIALYLFSVTFFDYQFDWELFSLVVSVFFGRIDLVAPPTVVKYLGIAVTSVMILSVVVAAGWMGVEEWRNYRSNGRMRWR